MKLLITIILCIALSANAVRAPTRYIKPAFIETSPPDACAWFYQHDLYRGFKDEICLGGDVASIADTFNHDNEYSSVKVGADVKAKLYRIPNFNWHVKTTVEDIPKFRTYRINDKIKSVKVQLRNPTNEKYCVTLFRNADYTGFRDTICFGNDVADVAVTFPGHDDHYSSIKVGSAVKAELYRHANFFYKDHTATEDIPRFRTYHMND